MASIKHNSIEADATEKALRDEIERLRKDAERYRWLRKFIDTKDVAIFKHRRDYGVEEWNENADAAIDAAIAKVGSDETGEKA